MSYQQTLLLIRKFLLTSYQQTLLLIRKFLLTYHSPISSFHLKRINSEVKKIILELTWTTLHKNKAKLHNNPLRFGSFANWPLEFQFCNIIGEINPSNYIFVNFANIKWPHALHLGFIIISFFYYKVVTYNLNVTNFY